jgi:hypothetical protein
MEVLQVEMLISKFEIFYVQNVYTFHVQFKFLIFVQFWPLEPPVFEDNISTATT